MGWFRRRDAARSAEPELPLDAAQAQRLRVLVRTAWAEAGRAVEVHSDHVVDANGAQFGLWNLAASVALEPPRTWPAIVADHVRRLDAPWPDVDDLSDAELRRRVVARLVNAETTEVTPWYPDEERLGGNLVETIVLDFPDRVIILEPSDLLARGALREWQAIARRNLFGLLQAEDFDHDRFRHRSGAFDVVTGEAHTASMALFLADVLDRRGVVDRGLGVLASLPMRHQIAFRVVEGPDVARALPHLFEFTLGMFSESALPVSPHVYWVRSGRWARLSTIDEDGARVEVEDELAEAMGLGRG